MKNLLKVVETTIQNRYDYVATDEWFFTTIKEATDFLKVCEETQFRYYTLEGYSDETRNFCFVEDSVFEQAKFVLSLRGTQGYMGIEAIILGNFPVSISEEEKIYTFQEVVKEEPAILNYRTIFVHDRE